MANTICIIDDQIPIIKEEGIITPGRPLYSSDLKLLLRHDWEERELRLLVEKLLSNNAWIVNAFTHPSFYLNYLDEQNIRPEIVVYDWDNGSATPKDDLLAILKKTFCVLAIYTRSEKEDDVNAQIINNQAFADYKNRVVLIIKSDPESETKLLETMKQMYEDSFSFKMGSELRKKSLNAVEDILVQLGKNSPKEVVWFLGEKSEIGGRQSRHLPINDLVAIIVEKLRNTLITDSFGTELPTVDTNPAVTGFHEAMNKLWAYRLYYKPSDVIVRKGDIIKSRNGSINTLFFVLSSDCHLEKFWNKNMGFLTIVPLHKLSADNAGLLRKLDLFGSPGTIKEINSSSITNTSNLKGPTILPALAINDGEYSDYLLCPKEIISFDIPLPSIEGSEANKRKICLKYDYLTEYDGSNRISLSEPFLTPLCQHILSSISGYGAPEYSEELKKAIKDNIKGMFPT